MPRQDRVLDELITGSCKIRKRGCSSSSSSSSVLQNYRFKRAILVGKARGSRSSTPVPTWRTSAALRAAAAESPKYAPSQNGGGRSRPVSARKLAATLWEMNEVPSPRVGENLEKMSFKREMRAKERIGAARSVYSGSLPPHLSDPSHSPVSERMDRSGTGSRHRKTSSISQRHRLAEHNVGVLDSLSSASLMEIETRSRCQTPSGSVVGVMTRLKDVSNALTTSKELLKIVNRLWARDDQPSSSISLISALHAELERARLQVNQLIHEQRSDQSDINYLMKCFAEEKAAWKNKEHQVVEAAIQSVAGELDVERKLRRRFESLNKKLGIELAETKGSLMKLVKELENEKRTREIMERVCDDLARDIGDDKAEVEELKRESAKIHEEAEKEREMLHVADMLHEERAQTKLSEAKHHFEKKHTVVDKLRNQLEAFMGSRRGKEKARSSLSHGNTEDIAAYLKKNRLGSLQNEIEDKHGEVEDGVDYEEDSAESDLHSIELNMDNINRTYNSATGRDSRRIPIDDEITGRKSTSGKAPRKSTSLLRTMSDGVEWGSHSERDTLYELEKQAQRKIYGDDVQVYRTVKGLKDQVLSNARAGSVRDFGSPTRQWGQAWPSRDPCNAVQERPSAVQVSGLTSRLAEARGEGQIARRSRR